ncbi:hypothetical protein [Granulicella tundricola]|uniref:Lipoprotein n=1 Tax=Granulicella tundricola (strain ATCC BAA-1859 / DSM 23138 / MP5ACTX9) TaxID=1198114 RepID=E8X2G4_GRATM|nr:hypothetical protein [Granulicella tundricola]ADW69188.1 hypothetical protein AciX9_2144 [Granulicella tundricola MP5ACTX9]
MFPKETWISLALMAVTSAALFSFLGCAHHNSAIAQAQHPSVQNHVRSAKFQASAFTAQHQVATPAAHVKQAIRSADPHAPVLRPIVQNQKTAKKKLSKLPKTQPAAL